MSVEVASFALSGALSVSPQCHWDRPAADRYTGDLVSAVDHYAGLSPASRERLKDKLARHAYDDRVVITRDRITGRYTYEPAIQDMHFGSDHLCRQVNRSRWPARRELQALVYCDGPQCLLVPAACGNLSRVERVGDEAADKNEPIEVAPAAGPTSAGAASPGGAAGAASLASLGQPAAERPATVTALEPLPPAAGPGESPPPATPPPPPVILPPTIYPVPVVYVTPVIRPPVTPTVPEPPSWAEALLGLPFVVLGWRYARRRHGKDQ